MNHLNMDADCVRAYQALFAFCGWALNSDPDAQTLEGFAQQAELFAQEPFTTVDPEAAAVLHEQFQAAAQDVAPLMDQIHKDRSWLFYMAGVSKTPPYESVYRTDDETMFGPTTLEVREAYKAWGLEYPKAASEPDDHCGLEFAFVAALLDAAANAADADGALEADGEPAAGVAPAADDALAAGAALDAAAAFLSEHLLVFAPVYLANLGKQARGPFYRAVASLSASTLAQFAEAVGAKAADAPKRDWSL